MWSLIGMFCLLPSYRISSMRSWILVFTSTWLSTYMLMVRVCGLSRHWRRCCRHVYWILAVAGIHIFLWLNFCITTITMTKLINLLLRCFMGESVGPRYVGVRSVSGSCGVLRWYSIRRNWFSRFTEDFREHKFKRKVTQRDSDHTWSFKLETWYS